MRDIQNGFDMQDLEYLAQEDFEKSAGDITSIFHEEKGLDGKYHIFAMVWSAQSRLFRSLYDSVCKAETVKKQAMRDDMLKIATTAEILLR